MLKTSDDLYIALAIVFLFVVFAGAYAIGYFQGYYEAIDNVAKIIKGLHNA